MLPLLTEDKKSRLIGCVHLNTVRCYLLLLQLASWQYLATTLLGSIWRIIQDKRQEEDKDRRIWNNRISLSLFFFTLLDRYLSSGLSLKQTAETISLPGLFYIPLAISGCTSCTVALVALDVDNFSCRSIILQKFSFSKVFLLCFSYLANSYLWSSFILRKI